MPENPKIVILGSIGIDSVKTPFGSAENAIGGSASFAAIACSIFQKPGIVSVAGEDIPRELTQLFEERGIDTRGIEIRKGEKTFRWQGEYGMDLSDPKTKSVDLNVLANFKPVLPEEYKTPDFLFLGNADPETQLNVLSQMKKRPKLVIADTMNFWIHSKREKVLEVVEAVDICLMNEVEARQLFETPNLAKAAREILKRNSKIAIIKKGEHGCIAFTDHAYFACPGYPLENVLDPTGSGDSFGGTLIGYLSQTSDFSEANMRKAIVYASCVASYNAEGFSISRLKKVTLSDVQKRYAEFQQFVVF